MPRPTMRDGITQVLGASHAYKAGTAHVTAQTVVAAQSTGLKIRVKAFRCILAHALADGTAVVVNSAWLSDGASTPLIGLAIQPAVDMAANTTTHYQIDSGLIVLPGFGVVGTAATALTIDFTATDANLAFQVDVYYDVVNATGDIQ